MALREYRCAKCGAVDTEITGYDGFPKTKRCRCGGTMKYRFGAPAFTFAFRAGWDDGAGEYFNSERERSNYLAKNGLRKVKD